MPRVKSVWQGVQEGEWAPANSTIGVCPHPRDRLRFDGSFPVPCYVYCCDCGTRYLSPHHGLTPEEARARIEKARAEAKELMERLGWNDDAETKENT